MYRLGSLIPVSTSSRRPTCRRARRRTFSCRASSGRIWFRRCRRPAVASRSAPADRPSRRTAGSSCRTTTAALLRPRTPNGRLMVYATQELPDCRVDAAGDRHHCEVGRRARRRGHAAADGAGAQHHRPSDDARRARGQTGACTSCRATRAIFRADPDVATSITNGDGEFAFLAVPAGQYVIQTVRVPRSGRGTRL